MSGHNKWSTIKHKKGKTDAQRGKIFTKIIREITTAAKQGGGDINANPRLRLAVDKAKEANMPNDNVDRAIAKATGGGDGAQLEELTYEGYGQGGVAILIEVITDNRNRTASEIRNLFTKNGGNMGASGSVSYLFHRKGSLVFEKGTIDEENLTMAAIDAGAEDIVSEDKTIEVITTPESFVKIKDSLSSQGFTAMSAEVSMIPQTQVKLEGEEAQKVVKLVQVLEDHDDVQSVHANFDVPDEILEQAS